MTVKELAHQLNLTVHALPEGDREISGVYIGDLLSWVMGRAGADQAWITIMSNRNIVAVATLADTACILLAEGVVPDEGVAQLAQEKGINLLTSQSGAYETALFLYSAKPLQAEQTALKVDGEEVTQKTGMTLLTAELAFTAVGRTGVVYRSAGMDIPERVETDENRMPTEERVQNGKQLYYHTLNENPTFLFTLDGMEGVDVKKMQVLSQ